MAAVNVKHDTYDTGKINALHQIIQNANNIGQRQDYEILVDDFKVIHRTCDPARFNEYADFINADTKTVTIVIYKGGSTTNDKYFFHVKGVPSKNAGLSGVPDNMSVQEWQEKEKERMRKELDFERLEEENDRLTQDVESKTKLIDELTDLLQKARDGKLITFSQIGSALLSGALNHPKLQGLFGGLSGTPQEQTPTAEQTNPESQASFTRKADVSDAKEVSEEKEPALTEEEQRYMQLVKDLAERLDKHHLSSVMHILDLLTLHPQVIGSTVKHIHNFLNQNPTGKA